MRLGHAAQVDVGERVAVDQKNVSAADDVERLARPAGAAEHDAAVPTSSERGAEIAAVAEDGGQRLRQVMEVQGHIGDAAAPRASERCAGSSGSPADRDAPAWRGPW